MGKKKEAKTIKTVGDEKKGGRGKKVCPDCGAELGARTKVCTTEGCGHEFEIKTTTATERTATKLDKVMSKNLMVQFIKESGSVALAKQRLDEFWLTYLEVQQLEEESRTLADALRDTEAPKE